MKRHDFNLDLIRAVAVVSVLSVHFFLNSGFYDTPLVGRSMVLAAVIRTFFMVCVPLFLLLTGYLKGAHRWSMDYYKGLVKLLLGYLLASLACLSYRTFFQQEALTPRNWVHHILDFSGAPYAWYIEMYLGIFLLIPFLNTLWAHLDDRAKRALLATFLFMTVLPTVNSVLVLLPDWWTSLYPVTYYFTGLYLREKSPRWNRGICLLLALLSAVAGGLLHAHYSFGGPMQYAPITFWNGIFPYVSSVCFFWALRKEGQKVPPRPVAWAVTKVASLSLPIFLLSWIPDQIVYGHLKQAVASMPQRLPWMLVTVPLVLLSATLLAQVLTWVQNGLIKLGGAALRRKRARDT